MYKLSPCLFISEGKKGLSIFNSSNGFMCNINEKELVSFFEKYWPNKIFDKKDFPQDYFDSFRDFRCIVNENQASALECVTDIENNFLLNDEVVIAFILQREGQIMSVENISKTLRTILNYVFTRHIKKLHIQFTCDGIWNGSITVFDDFLNELNKYEIRLTISLIEKEELNEDFILYFLPYITLIELNIKYRNYTQQLQPTVLAMLKKYNELIKIHLLCSLDEKMEIEKKTLPFQYSYSIISENMEGDIYSDCFLTEIVKLEETREYSQNADVFKWMRPMGLVCSAAYNWFFIIDYDSKIKKCMEHLDDPQNVIGYIEKDEIIFEESNVFQYVHDVLLLKENCNTCPAVGLCFGMNCPWKSQIENNPICPLKKEFINDYLSRI